MPLSQSDDSNTTDSQPLSRPRFRILLLVLACSVLCLALVYPFPMKGRGWSALFDLAHSPAFFATFLAIVILLDPSAAGLKTPSVPLIRLTGRRLAVLAAFFVTGGIVCEMAQKFFDRHPSVSDIIANCAGLLSAAMFCFGIQIPHQVPGKILLTLSACILFLPCWSPFLESLEYLKQRAEFPLLASFERSQELTAWSPHNAVVKTDNTWFTHGSQSMKVTASGGAYPGNLMVWPVGDWRQYAALELDLHNPGLHELTIGINIGDAIHYLSGFDPADRYSCSVSVPAQSARHVRIKLSDVQSAPVKRKTAMSHISHLDVFMIEPPESSSFHLDNVRLQPAPASAPATEN